MSVNNVRTVLATHVCIPSMTHVTQTHLSSDDDDMKKICFKSLIIIIQIIIKNNNDNNDNNENDNDNDNDNDNNENDNDNDNNKNNNKKIKKYIYISGDKFSQLLADP